MTYAKLCIGFAFLSAPLVAGCELMGSDSDNPSDSEDPCFGDSIGPGLIPCNGSGFRLTDSSPGWTPDESKIVLWVINRNGSGVEQITF